MRVACSRPTVVLLIPLLLLFVTDFRGYTSRLSRQRSLPSKAVLRRLTLRNSCRKRRRPCADLSASVPIPRRNDAAPGADNAPPLLSLSYPIGRHGLLHVSRRVPRPRHPPSALASRLANAMTIWRSWTLRRQWWPRGCACHSLPGSGTPDKTAVASWLGAHLRCSFLRSGGSVRLSSARFLQTSAGAGKCFIWRRRAAPARVAVRLAELAHP
jgi:hypothetical protein